MQRNCPTCGVALQEESFMGIQLDVCPRCAGIWFDEGELKRIKDAGTAAMQQLDDKHLPSLTQSVAGGTAGSCPACSGAMYRYKYLFSNGVQLDGCEKCGGVWVENGELIKMTEDLKRSGESKYSDEQLAALADAAEGEVLSERQKSMAEFRANMLKVLGSHSFPFVNL